MALSTISGTTGITDATITSAKLADFAAAVDLNGVELILDADQDTSITADTDDRIDFKIAGVEHISISNSSGDTIIKPMVDAKDIVFQQYDGNKIFEINDANFVAVSGAAAGPGEIRIYEDTDNGTHYTGFKAGNNTASVAYVLPTADGTDGFQLTTDGSGTLSWSSAGVALANDANNRVVTADGSGGINGEANLTFDGSTLTNAGATQLNSTLTVGANDQGYDVILYGDTASANMTWDTSADDLILNGAARIVIPDGQLVLGSTAVTSTAAELNLLDNVSGLVQADLTKLAAVDSTAAELNIVDGGTSATSTTVADADRVVLNDNGTMVQVAVTDLSAYFDDEITAMPNLVTTAATTVGALASGSIAAGFGAIDNGTSGIRTNTFTAETAFVPDASGGADLGTTSLEFNDAFFNDGAVINFGDDQDVTLTHTADTGLTLNSTMKLMFNDASQFIQGASATVLDIAATDEIELTATLIDVVGNLAGSGTGTFAGILKTDDTTEATSTTDGSLQTDGGLSVAKDIVAGDDIKLLSDASVIHFGANSEVTLTHSHDAGLILKHTATADDKPINLILQTGETDMAANDVIGKISWQAPDEGTGTDAILISAAIQAKAEGDHSSSSNATSLEFMTGASEAAAAKVRITSAGHMVPTVDDSYDLGSGSLQWRNIYTGDLHLSNMTKDVGNSVDGTKGDWTIQEGAEDLFLLNNNSGKKYKFNLTEIE